MRRSARTKSKVHVEVFDTFTRTVGPSGSVDPRTMDVDEVWERIGEFGPAQKKIFFLVNLAQVYGALTVFAISFAGIDPGWSCSLETEEATESAVTQDLTDPVLKCYHYERGECDPAYSNRFTSIVTEVRSKQDSVLYSVTPLIWTPLGFLFGEVSFTIVHKCTIWASLESQPYWLARLYLGLQQLSCLLRCPYFRRTWLEGLHFHCICVWDRWGGNRTLGG